MVAKAARSDADAVCIDLEDSVASEQKGASRRLAVESLVQLQFGGRTRIVRVNACDTVWTYGDVIEVVMGAGAQVDLLMLPKVRNARDVHFVDQLLSQVEGRAGLARRIGLEVQIESASGFLHVGEIAAASARIEALIFGMGDYAASMRMPLTSIGAEDEHDAAYGSHRWHAVMHGIVAAARAHGLRCMDGPFANYRDDVGLRRASRMARAMGFDGKQCIHPGQLATVNAAFAPSDAEVMWARSVVETYERARAGGSGAVGSDGMMIDAANLRMAQTTLRAAEARAEAHPAGDDA